MNISVIGTGYVGLVAGVYFAKQQNTVYCMDDDAEKIALLIRGKIPIYEPGLKNEVFLQSSLKRLLFTTSIEEAVNHAEVIFITVGTPTMADGNADMSQLETVSRRIAETMKGYKVIVEKSTVPVGAGEWIKKTINTYNKKNIPFDVVSNPEFLREGSALEDMMQPDRVVLGVDSKRARKVMEKLYTSNVLFTDIKSAELIKHASNSFLATKISFINMVADICEKVGANIDDVAKGMGMDKRIGERFLRAGIGYGGSCFPKDVKAFIRLGEKSGCNFQLLKEVEKINQERRKLIVEKIKEALWVLKGKRIGVLGLSFKPDTDDIREAPSIDIIKALVDGGAKVWVYDPVAMNKFRELDLEVNYCSEAIDVAKGADALVILTEWDEFRDLEFIELKKLMARPLIIDGRNIAFPKIMKEEGFTYISIGR